MKFRVFYKNLYVNLEVDDKSSGTVAKIDFANGYTLTSEIVSKAIDQHFLFLSQKCSCISFTINGSIVFKSIEPVGALHLLIAFAEFTLKNKIEPLYYEYDNQSLMHPVEKHQPDYNDLHQCISKVFAKLSCPDWF